MKDTITAFIIAAIITIIIFILCTIVYYFSVPGCILVVFLVLFVFIRIDLDV